MTVPLAAGSSGSFVDPEARTIFDAIADSILVLDSNWRIQYVNPEGLRVLRQPAGSVVGQILWDVWPAAAGSEIERQYRRALHDQMPASFEHHYLAPDYDVWTEIRAYPFRTGLAVNYRDITARKQTEQALRESEERYRATFDNAPVGIAHVGLDGRWLRFNHAVCAITGYSREELHQKTFADITHPEDVETDWALARRVAAGEIPTYTIEKRYVRKDGAIVWVNLTVSLLRRGDGTPEHFISVIEDITARKQAEAALRERDERLHSVLESIGDSFMAFDRDWNFTYVNAAWERMSGFSREHVLGKNRWDLFPATRGSNLETEFLRAVREGAPVEFETFYLPWQRWYAIRAYPTKDGGLSCYSRDITESRSAQDALRESEERYRSLVSATSALVWTADAKGEFSWPQPSWEAYTGQRWEEYKGGGWIEAIHPEDREQAAEAWRTAVATKSIHEAEWRAWHAASRQWRHCFSRGVPLLRPDGQVKEWIGAVSDIHDRKLLEARLQHDDKLESLGVLAGGVAHDFNNLLVGILGNASLAMETAGAELRPLLADIVKASERAADLTRQMLAYAGKGHFQFEPLDLSREVREVVALVRSSLNPSAYLDLGLAGNPPAIYADRGQLQQIVMNLIINASEALDAKGGHIRVGVSTDGKERVVLTVQDDGVGMTSEIKARIFDPFFSTKFTGRGLGLAAVMGAVRAHHGSIEVDSMPGRGATFRVFFPASREIVPAQAEQENITRAAASIAVLVIDDEQVVLKVAKTTLERAGVRSFFAGSAREGVQIFRERAHEIDLVILDASMPDMGGPEALRAIREIRPDVPVIVSSGHPASEIARYFGNSAPSALLPKPYKPAALAAAVALHGARVVKPGSASENK